MSKYIENICIDENRIKVNTIKWRTIYEVIDESSIKDFKVFKKK